MQDLTIGGWPSLDSGPTEKKGAPSLRFFARAGVYTLELDFSRLVKEDTQHSSILTELGPGSLLAPFRAFAQ